MWILGSKWSSRSVGQVSELGVLAVTGNLQLPECRATCTQVTVQRGLPPHSSVAPLRQSPFWSLHDKLSISNLHEIISTMKIFLILSGNNHACGFGIIICDLNKLSIYRARSFISNLLQAKKREK